MTNRTTAFPFAYRSMLVAAALAVLAGPVTAQSAEAGAKTREEVKKELDKAHKAGTHEMGGEASTVKQPVPGSKASRAQVKKDLDKAHREGTHEMGGEVSSVKQPAPSSNTTRKQVKKELDKAHKDGTHDMGGEVSPTKP